MIHLKSLGIMFKYVYSSVGIIPFLKKIILLKKKKKKKMRYINPGFMCLTLITSITFLH